VNLRIGRRYEAVTVADMTNNIDSSGTANTLANITDLTTYANDAAAIKGNLYQLGQKVNAIMDVLQQAGHDWA
jgi:hypothetical protein